jgi:hypothetical protein
MVRQTRWFLTALALIAVATSTTAQAPSTETPAPWANKLFLPDIASNPAQRPPAEIVHDFGTVPQGTICRQTFRITNIYDVPLQLLEVRSSCSCLVCDRPQKTLLANESAEVTVSLDTRRLEGAVSQTLEVTVGPLHISTARFKFLAISRPDLLVSPGRADFGTVPLGEEAKVRLTLEYHGVHADWQPTEVVVPNSKLQATLRPDPQAESGGVKRYFLDLSLPRHGITAGAVTENVTLRSNMGEEVQIPVLGTIRPPLELSQTEADLGMVRLGETFVHRLMVRAPGGLFQIEATGADDLLSVETFPAAAPVQIITLRYTPQKAGPFERDITIRSSRGGEATVRVRASAE